MLQVTWRYELIEIIAPFIEDEDDFKAWLKCYKELKNFGDLSLILDLDECGGTYLCTR